MSWLVIGYLINIVIALIIVFRDVRDISSTLAWLLVLLFLPYIGLILYLFIGKKLTRDNIFDMKRAKKMGLTHSPNQQLKQLTAGKLYFGSHSEKEMIGFFLETDSAVYSEKNRVTIIEDGIEKFDRLLEDIKQAKNHIHMQYYIFQTDELGTKIMDVLKEKAMQGVEVKVLYDAWGSHTIRPIFFKKLTRAGGKALPFFGSSIPFVNLRMNYRNHRKIVVIDGRIGYVGGFNIGDEYLGKGKLGYWRDTHLRIEGEAVHSLQTRFSIDWNAVADSKEQISYHDAYFPSIAIENIAPMQIVTSGPDEEIDQIKLGFIKMISMAKESIYIQTPYFIPDESVTDALCIAIKSGVSVHLMIPNKPDHIIVYRATEYYAKQLAQIGAKVYVYNNGFLHAKVLIIDGKVSSVGTANFDIRSFKLNFEISSFIYDRQVSHHLQQRFTEDVKQSTVANSEYFDKQSTWKKIKQQFARLFSPIL